MISDMEISPSIYNIQRYFAICKEDFFFVWEVCSAQKRSFWGHFGLKMSFLGQLEVKDHFFSINVVQLIS